jgi:hypothetical protein
MLDKYDALTEHPPTENHSDISTVVSTGFLLTYFFLCDVAYSQRPGILCLIVASNLYFLACDILLQFFNYVTALPLIP